MDNPVPDHTKIRQLQKILNNLLNELNFEPEIDIDPELSSWWKVDWWKTRVKTRTDEIFQKTKILKETFETIANNDETKKVGQEAYEGIKAKQFGKSIAEKAKIEAETEKIKAEAIKAKVEIEKCNAEILEIKSRIKKNNAEADLINAQSLEKIVGICKELKELSKQLPPNVIQIGDFIITNYNITKNDDNGKQFKSEKLTKDQLSQFERDIESIKNPHDVAAALELIQSDNNTQQGA